MLSKAAKRRKKSREPKKKKLLREMREKREIMMKNWCLANTHSRIQYRRGQLSKLTLAWRLKKFKILPAWLFFASDPYLQCAMWWIIRLRSIRCKIKLVVGNFILFFVLLSQEKSEKLFASWQELLWFLWLEISQFLWWIAWNSGSCEINFSYEVTCYRTF